MEDATSSRIARALYDGGILQPESCPIVLKALEGIQSQDSQKRIIGISRLRTCGEYLRDTGHPELVLNLVVFLLERGVVKGIAAAFRAIVARGEWHLEVPEMDISIRSKSRLKITINKAFICGICLRLLAADKRCVSTILKDFPDLAGVARATFLTRPPYPADFEKKAKLGVLAVLVPMLGFSPRFRKELVRDTSFLREVLRQAERVREDASQAEFYIETVSITYNITQVVKKGDLQLDLLEFVGTLLATSKSRDQMEVAIRMLVRLLQLCDQQGPRSSSVTAAGLRHPLDSSLLALLSLKTVLDRNVWSSTAVAAIKYWKSDYARLGWKKLDALLKDRFENDERASRRATELSRIFSAPSEGFFSAYYRKSQTGSVPEEALDWGPSFPLKKGLECRKCSHASCENLEVEGGTFKVCGRCRMAVYCSRDCQKRAWKEGHKELCH